MYAVCQMQYNLTITSYIKDAMSHQHQAPGGCQYPYTVPQYHCRPLTVIPYPIVSQLIPAKPAATLCTAEHSSLQRRRKSRNICVCV